MYLEAYNQLALAYCFDYVNRWSDDPDSSLAEAQRLAQTSIELAPNEPRAHDTASLAANFAGNIDRSRREAETAITLDPSYPGANFQRGMLCLTSDDPLSAVPHFERGMRRDPSLESTILYLQLLGMAYFFGGRYETAIALFRERIVLMPDTDFSRAYLASALGHLGQISEARRVLGRTDGDQPEVLTRRPHAPRPQSGYGHGKGHRGRAQGRAVGLAN